jgi:OPA family sugar phosphate sensor protein UhpC-like MFS transporter
MEAKSFPEFLASTGVFWFEAGGLLGMIAAGWGSDFFFKGNRVPSMVISALGLIFSVLALWYSPPNHTALDLVCLTFIGFFVFGPQMIVGLAAAEHVDKRAAAASNGFAGTLGYFGAACAGYPIGKVIDIWGWNGFYLLLVICSIIIFGMLLPLWSTQSQVNSPNKAQWLNKPRKFEEA